MLSIADRIPQECPNATKLTVAQRRIRSGSHDVEPVSQAVKEKVRQAARRSIPPWLWARLRLLRQAHHLRSYPCREVRHLYGGFPLTIQLPDSMAASWYDHNVELGELSVLRRGRLQDGARVFDLGAHHGVNALVLAKTVGQRGEVIAVEATRHSYEVALLNKNRNNAANLEIVHAAVSDRSGTIAFNPLNGHVHAGKSRFEHIPVRAVTIDELAAKYGGPDVLYIDVEGFECHTLRGARATLGTRPDAFVEVHVNVGLEKFGGSVDELLSFFPSPDYDVLVAAEGRDYLPFAQGSSVTRDRFFLVALGRPSKKPV